jgi:hypothetical protein
MMAPRRDALPSLVQRAQVTQAGAGVEDDAPPAAAESTVKRAHDDATSTLSAH